MSDTSRTPIRLTMSMTLDGFVTGPDDDHDGVPIHVLTHHPDDVPPGRGVTHLRYAVRYS